MRWTAMNRALSSAAVLPVLAFVLALVLATALVLTNVRTASARPSSIGATMSANGTIQPAHFARLNFDLHLGQVVATRVMALVPERAGDGESAIGARLLRHFRVRLDPVSGLARFDHPDGLTEVPMPVWRIHGFTVTLENSPLPVITEVNPGSPAEVGGLLVGDVVLAIDGRSLGDSLDAWPGPTTDQAITDREFVVRRGDATVTLRLGLTEYLEEPYFYRLFQKNAARAAAQADETQPEVADSTPKEPAQDATPTTSTP